MIDHIFMHGESRRVHEDDMFCVDGNFTHVYIRCTDHERCASAMDGLQSVSPPASFMNILKYLNYYFAAWSFHRRGN
jgi:hypothetical protein